MITGQQLLAQMEAHVSKAKNAVSEQTIRDEVVALKALCELFLAAPTNSSTDSQSIKNREYASSALPSPVQPVKAKLVEDDANGDSIFDF